MAEEQAKQWQKNRDARWSVNFLKVKINANEKSISAPLSFSPLALPHSAIDQRHVSIRSYTAISVTTYDNGQPKHVLDKSNLAGKLSANTPMVKRLMRCNIKTEFWSPLFTPKGRRQEQWTKAAAITIIIA